MPHIAELTSPQCALVAGYGSVGTEQSYTALYFGVSVSPVLFNFTLTPQTQLVRAMALKPQRNIARPKVTPFSLAYRLLIAVSN